MSLRKQILINLSFFRRVAKKIRNAKKGFN